MIKTISHCLVLCFIINTSFAQNFSNSDLDGSITGISTLPTGWQAVPFTDPICTATANGQDSPDLADATQPFLAVGIMGNPYSGSTFVTGLAMLSASGNFRYHEGIMQSVNGFVVGDSYTVHFQQSVVKQGTALDTSGSWSVYINSTLAGTTAPTTSQAPFNSTAFNWQSRSISFVATSTSHTIKFLPDDDDLDHSASNSNLNGALRMGIDSIFIESKCVVPISVSIGPDTILCLGDSLQMSAGVFNSYLWSPASALSCTTCANPFASTTTGVQISVEVWDSNSCASSDSMQFEIENMGVNLGADTVICAGETIILNAMNSGKTHLWQDSSTNPTFAATAAGTYWVTVTSSLGCTVTDTIGITTCVARTPLQNKMEFQLYPNPFTDRLNINNPMVGEINIEILDQLGRIVLREYGDHEQFSIDVSSIPLGIYFCRIISKYNETFIQKLVKH